jgi:hypothetical protein
MCFLVNVFVYLLLFTVLFGAPAMILYGASDGFRVWIETFFFGHDKVELTDFRGETRITYAKNRVAPWYAASGISKVALADDGTCKGIPHIKTWRKIDSVKVSGVLLAAKSKISSIFTKAKEWLYE